MVSENKKLFDDFKNLHDRYALTPDGLQEEFNQEGEKVLAVVHEWENKLCRQSEKAGFGNYTTGLAEKFQGELKKIFPKIDHVGIISKKETPFFLKRIKL